jgi:hypothetical protein
MKCTAQASLLKIGFPEMITRKHFLTFLATSAMTLALVTTGSLVEGKGKPGGDPPPVLPKVRYEVQYFTAPSNDVTGINALNNRGQVVGNFHVAAPDVKRHAFLYDPNGLHIPADIYDPVVHANRAVDLNAIGVEEESIPPNWHIASATGINNQGVVVGYLSPEDMSERRGFVLDLSKSPLVLETIPDEAFGTYTYPRRINDNGDIVGHGDIAENHINYVFNLHDFRLNPVLDGPYSWLSGSLPELSNPAPGQPAIVAGLNSSGLAIRYTLDGTDATTGTLETFPDLNSPRVYDINSAGTFCGTTYIPINRKGTRISRRPFRYGPVLETLSDDSFWTAVAINSDGDTVLDQTGFDNPQAIYHDKWGLLNLDDLVADADLLSWLPSTNFANLRLNDRDAATDFGQIAGRCTVEGGPSKGFVLTPVVVP